MISNLSSKECMRNMQEYQDMFGQEHTIHGSMDGFIRAYRQALKMTECLYQDMHKRCVSNVMQWLQSVQSWT